MLGVLAMRRGFTPAVTAERGRPRIRQSGTLNWTGLNAGFRPPSSIRVLLTDGWGFHRSTQDNGSITRTSAAGVWTNTACGDGGFSAIDTTTSPYTFYTGLHYNRASNDHTPTIICHGRNNNRNTTHGPNATRPCLSAHGERPDTPQHALLRGQPDLSNHQRRNLVGFDFSSAVAGSTGNISTISIAPGGTATSGMAYAEQPMVRSWWVQIAGARGHGQTSVALACLLAMLPTLQSTHEPRHRLRHLFGFLRYNGDTQGTLFLTTNTGGHGLISVGTFPTYRRRFSHRSADSQSLYAATDIGVSRPQWRIT